MTEQKGQGAESISRGQEKTPLLDAVASYAKERPAYFKIPGHRYERGISPRWRAYTGDGIFQFDLTEAEGLDDLHAPSGVIRRAQELTADLFGARASYFLVNGTTCGNEAMVLTCAAEGEKILIPRNVHKSVLMGLILSGARPEYLMPPQDPVSGLWGSISPQQAEEGFFHHPDCKGLLLVSPTYYGVCSDLEAIGAICRKNHALLMVDEAHGGHLYFHDPHQGTEELPRGALLQGADLCTQSMHKVTGSLTQSSLLHIGSERVDQGRLEANLRLVQSTSPSYLLMTSLDAARYELAKNGAQMLGRALFLAENARERIRRIPGLTCYGTEIRGAAIHDLDVTRLVISGAGLGISGYDLADRLYQKYRVGMELADGDCVVAVITYANTMEEIDRLVDGCEKIAREFQRDVSREKTKALPLPAIPPYVLSPRQAYFAHKVRVPWREARGKIAGEAWIPYPPGIPLICPGERLSGEIWEYMETCREAGISCHGPADRNLDYFQIIPE